MGRGAHMEAVGQLEIEIQVDINRERWNSDFAMLCDLGTVAMQMKKYTSNSIVAQCKYYLTET
jgi:hypothetical protein